MSKKKRIEYTDESLIEDLNKKLKEVRSIYTNYGAGLWENVIVNFGTVNQEKIDSKRRIRIENIEAAIACLCSEEKVSVIVFKKIF